MYDKYLFATKHLLVLFLVNLLEFAYGFNCLLPVNCRIDYVTIFLHSDLFGYERTFNKKLGLKCEIRYGYRFDYDGYTPLIKPNESCKISDYYSELAEFRWIEDSDKAILDSTFNMGDMLNYLRYFSIDFDVKFVNLKGFDLDVINPYQNETWLTTLNAYSLKCVNCLIDFYTNESLIRSCQEMRNKKIRSFFQLRKEDDSYFQILLYDCTFRSSLCPAVFKNSYISQFHIIGLIDSFYKKRILSFFNDTSFENNLNSKITELHLVKTQNINLDSKLIHPEVFKLIWVIYVFGSVNQIERDVFKDFKSLIQINFEKNHFRDMIHKNGIDWIICLNEHLHVNLSDLNELARIFNQRTYIRLVFEIATFGKRLSKVFPDEDFCLYKDYPFDQLIILMEYAYDDFIYNMIPSDYTCTYLWLTKYFNAFLLLKPFPNDEYSMENMQRITRSYQFKNISMCNFEYRLSLCNKSSYQMSNWFGISDYLVLNKKIEIGIKITKYFVSLFGLATNLIVIVTIMHKKNAENFKDLKHFSYLCLISVFNVLILVIEMLSWINECFYPFEVFCPEIRKIVVIQFFKIIFKEIIVTTFRFMSNFGYLAFSLNRLSLIGKDHFKLIEFMSKVGIKKYIGLTCVLSLIFSSIKYFKYNVNYDQPTSNFPISNEWDLFANENDIYEKKLMVSLKHVFFILNSISDIFNYIIFVIICTILDVYMVIKLKRTIDEKMNPIKVTKNDGSKDNEEKDKKKKNPVNRAIKMVLINTIIGVLFKTPLSFMSLLNLYAAFYYKGYENSIFRPVFGEFYTMLFETGFYGLFLNLSEFLYTFSMSIQLFIYIRFDKKFKFAFYNLFVNDKESKNNNKPI